MYSRNAGFLIAWLPLACAPSGANTASIAADSNRLTASVSPAAGCPTSDSVVFAGTKLADRDGWYGKQLRALGEGGFCANANAAPERYRFVWIPSFHPSIVVRAERNGSSQRLVAKILSGAGGYEPGTVRRDTSIVLSAGEWTELTRLIEASGFWTAPPESERVGLDGAQWIIEGLRGGRYNVVDRWSPERDGPHSRHRAVGEWLLRRSGLASADLVREY